jgi:2'-5' RNA ligase
MQDAIQEATACARASLGSELVRWVPIRNIHLTLKFLGDSPRSTLKLVEDAMEAEVTRYAPFDVLVGGSGAYPHKDRPRVFWVGLNAPRALAALHHKLDQATARLGYDSENRGFSPHLTIGRVRPNVQTAGMQRLREELGRTRVGNLGTVHVQAVHLFKSDLQPTGSKYTRLFTARLEGAST